MVEGQEPPTAETMEQIDKDVDALNDDLKREGARVFAGGLHPPTTATVVQVQVQEGETFTTDGPFATGSALSSPAATPPWHAAPGWR